MSAIVLGWLLRASMRELLVFIPLSRILYMCIIALSDVTFATRGCSKTSQIRILILPLLALRQIQGQAWNKYEVLMLELLEALPILSGSRTIWNKSIGFLCRFLCVSKL